MLFSLNLAWYEWLEQLELNALSLNFTNGYFPFDFLDLHYIQNMHLLTWGGTLKTKAVL